LAALKRISGDVGSTPLKLMQRTGERQKRVAREHPVHRVLHEQPNPEQTPMDFREMMTGFSLSAGNAYAEIVRDGGAEVQELWPIVPHRVVVRRDQRNRVYYQVRLPNGKDESIPAENMFHLRGFSRDGILGLDVISKMREAIGLTLALEEFSARFFSNGTAASGVLKHPGRLKGEAHERLKSDWTAKRTGLSNMHKAIILEEGMDWQPLGVPPEASQMIESRRFGINEVSRIFLMPPHLLGDLERATFSNVEQQFLEYLTLTLRHHYVRWEQTADWRLLLPSERGDFYVKHNTAALLMATTKERYDAYQVAINNGWLSPNDVRELEDQNPYEGGDVYVLPMNLMKVSEIGMLPASGDEPPPEPPDDDAGGQGATSFRMGGPLEARALRSIGARSRLRALHGPQLQRVVGKIVAQEAKALRQIADAQLGQRSIQGFQLQVEKFYGRDLEARMLSELEPVFYAYAREIFGAAMEEVGGAESPPAELQRFVRQFTQNFARRWVRSSKGQLRQLVVDAATQEDLARAVEDRFVDWESKRADQAARHQVVEMEGAVSKFAYLAAGIMAMRWVASGENCPLCSQLDGRIVGIRSSFLSKGDTLNPGGDTAPLVASQNFSHAPIHDSCDCFIVAA
jgi:HK97 family phage portal protein